MNDEAKRSPGIAPLRVALSAASDATRKARNFCLTICAVNFASTYYLWDRSIITRPPFENPTLATTILAGVLYFFNLFLPLIPVVGFWIVLVVWRKRQKEHRRTPFPWVAYAVCYGLFVFLVRYVSGRSLL